MFQAHPVPLRSVRYVLLCGGVQLGLAQFGGKASPGAYPTQFVPQTLQRVQGPPPTSAQMATYYGAAAAPPDLDQSNHIIHLSRKAANIIGGLTESFLGGPEAKLSPQELKCLSTGASKLAGGMMDTAGRSAQTMHLFMNQARASSSPQQGRGLPNFGVVGLGTPMNPNALNPVDPLIAGLEVSQRIASMMEFENKLANECLKDDAKQAIKAASHHLSNMTYVGGRLVSNGVDIITELSKAVGAYDNEDYRTFGDNLGLAARKVLLAKRGEGLHGLLKMPTPAEIEEVTGGLVDSIFGPGMTMDVSSDMITTMAPPPPMYVPPPRAIGQNPDGSFIFEETTPLPTLVPWVLLPAADVTVDLHQCVQGNRELFKNAWTPVWKAMSKLVQSARDGSVAEAQDEMSMVEDATESGAQGFGALAMSMLDMQIALRRCGFTAEQEAILWDAIQAGEGWHTKFHVPHDQKDVESSDVTKNMGTAIAAWKNHDYEKFGSLVGVTLRQLALTTFPEKYAVDDMGVLRRKLLNLDQIGQHSAFQVASRSWLYVIAGLLISSFAALVLIRTQRTVARYGPVETQSRSHPILESFDREDMQV